jgi:diguanylate cyclase (GGDEF)-like protein
MPGGARGVCNNALTQRARTAMTIHQFADNAWYRLTGLMQGELTQSELSWLALPQVHQPLLARRRAVLIVHRVRMFALLFAVLTPLWSIIDLVVFPFPLWLSLALMRFAACGAFTALLLYYKPNGNLLNAYRAMAILFAIPTLFYVASHTLLGNYQLSGFSAAIGAGYAFLPFVLLAGLSIFPLTLVENLLIASPILMAQALSGYLRWSTMEWPSYVGAFWLMFLITGVSALAGMSQLAFMIALVRQAIRDPLTGVFSRRSGEEVIELQFTIATRNSTSLAVAFVDLDHFKTVNDRFGHEAGDKVLTGMTAIVGANLRRGDTLARWGGEEFVLIMPDTDIEQAEKALERLRGIGLGLRPDGTPVTASIGIAERVADQMDDWHALIELADQRMYHAKQGGRDRVVSGHELVAAA